MVAQNIPVPPSAQTAQATSSVWHQYNFKLAFIFHMIK